MISYRIIVKTGLLFGLFFLFSCAGIQQIKQEGEGGIVNMGSYTIMVPPGGGWNIKADKGSGYVLLIKKSFMPTMRITSIAVAVEMIRIKDWDKDEEEVANNIWDSEVEETRKRGNIIGYSIQDVNRNVVILNAKKRYAMSYTIIEQRAPIDDRTVQYLYFPDDFRERHIIHRFIVSEFFDRGIHIEEKHLEKLSPVINSFQVINSTLLLQVCINVLMAEEAAKGNFLNVMHLIEKGADVNAIITKGFLKGSPLILAAVGGHTEIVKLLLDRGAHINIKDEEHGATALLYAVNAGQTEIVKLLIDRSADVNLKSKEGYTALSIARMGKKSEIIKLIEAVGAKE